MASPDPSTLFRNTGLCLAVFGIVAYLFPVLGLIHDMALPFLTDVLVNRDFVNYWMAGRLIRADQTLHLFIQPVYFAHLTELFGPEFPIHNWGYPPHFLFFVWPLGWFGYEAGLVVFLATTFLLFVLSVRVFVREYAASEYRLILVMMLASFSLLLVDTAQNGFLTAALMLFGLAYRRRMPWVAGLAFGLLTIKPQLGLLIPLLLLFERNWAAIAWSALFFGLFVLLSALVFGWESWALYFLEVTREQRGVMDHWYGVFLAMMPTVFGSLRQLGVDASQAYVAQSVVSLITLVWLIRFLRRPLGDLERVAAILAATILISPYAFNYDLGALVVVAVLLAIRLREISLPAACVWLLVAASPSLIMLLGEAGLPLAPLLYAAALLVLQRSQTRTAAASGAPVSQEAS